MFPSFEWPRTADTHDPGYGMFHRYRGVVANGKVTGTPTYVCPKRDYQLADLKDLARNCRIAVAAIYLSLHIRVIGGMAHGKERMS